MKIQQVKINFVRLPLEEPLVGAPPMPGMLREFFTVQILTDDGIEGIGITTFGGKLIRTLKTRLTSSANSSRAKTLCARSKWSPNFAPHRRLAAPAV
jgi:L-alanine-DL-glutamate epimerase-like enolase superfamily enzyme